MIKDNVTSPDSTGNPPVHWTALRVWWLTSGEGAARECTDSERLAALREFRATGAMNLRVLADPALYSAEGEPLDGADGPYLCDAGPDAHDIDWTGLDDEVAP
jgi:hypothetical protein